MWILHEPNEWQNDSSLFATAFLLSAIVIAIVPYETVVHSVNRRTARTRYIIFYEKKKKQNSFSYWFDWVAVAARLRFPALL